MTSPASRAAASHVRRTRKVRERLGGGERVAGMAWQGAASHRGATAVVAMAAEAVWVPAPIGSRRWPGPPPLVLAALLRPREQSPPPRPAARGGLRGSLPPVPGRPAN